MALTTPQSSHTVQVMGAMDRRFAGKRAGVLLFFAVMVTGAVWCQRASAEQLKQARVTQVFNDVKLLPTQAAPRPASVNDEVKQGTAVRTGTASRTELTFTDLTITRLGANTVFSFQPGTREVKINSGAILIQIPPGAPEARVSTAAVSAAISGGTAIFDAPTGKFMILEGIGRFWRTGHPEQSTIVHAGQIVWLTRAGRISRPQTISVKRLVQTSLLITEFETLPNADLIEQVIQQQEGGEEVLPPEKTEMEIISQRYAVPSPSPMPSSETEFGSPPTISSPNPYAIGADTTITTDPIVTTNNVTDRGTVYRGPSVDGPYSTWAFGSTSPFDSSSGFNAQMDHRSSALKFAALELSGDPTVEIIGDKTSLALIGVSGVTSTEPGGVLSFGGIPELLLATQNGSVTLGPEVSFNVQGLTIYARGAGSDLMLGSDITATQILRLYAEHDIAISSMINAPAIQMIAGHDILLDQFVTTQTVTTPNGSVLLEAGNNIAAIDLIVINRTAAAGSANVDVTLDAGADLTIGTGFLGNGLSLAIDNSGGNNLSSGAAIAAVAGGNIIVNGGPGFLMLIDNSGSSSLGGDAVIDVGAPILATAADFNATINNQAGGIINGDATISINSPVDVFIGGNAIFQVLNSGAPGGQITGGASIDVNTANFTTNSLLAQINSDGGAIGSNAVIDFTIDDTLTVGGDATIEIEAPTAPIGTNSIDLNGGTYAVGGTFLAAMRGGDGMITLNTASIHADTVKVGCLGANGVLNIGPGMISADTLLKLYAGGSNGTINFNGSVTLNGNSAKIIAANTINIFNGVVLTINGPMPADIYTNNPNYAVASGGNGVHGGIITGTAGANAPQPLANAPGFDDTIASSSSVAETTEGTSKARTGRRTRTARDKPRQSSRSLTTNRRISDRRRAAIRVADTNQLLDLIDTGIPTSGKDAKKGTAKSNRKPAGERGTATGSNSGDSLGPASLAARRGSRLTPSAVN